MPSTHSMESCYTMLYYKYREVERVCGSFVLLKTSLDYKTMSFILIMGKKYYHDYMPSIIYVAILSFKTLTWTMLCHSDSKTATYFIHLNT